MELVEVGTRAGSDIAALQALERGNILFFPESPFSVREKHRETLLSAGQADGNFHKNIAYRPITGKVTGLGKTNPGEAAMVKQAMSSYSQQAIRFLNEFLAPYQEAWKVDYASFRSIEEKGRDLPVKKRNDLLHTDAFPTRPTNGGLILRFFTNVNLEKTRDWMTSDPFSILAPKYAREAGLIRIGGHRRPWWAQATLQAAKTLGLPVVNRSPYDEFMLGFHDFLKLNATYQRDCTKYKFNFPPGSSWMVFTDVVPHAVLAGRYALEQTIIVSRESLLEPDRAPISILEALSGRKLTL